MYVELSLENIVMTARMYWITVVAVLGCSSVFWWAVFSWLGVTSPTALVAFFDAVVLTSYMLFLKWWLQEPDHINASAEAQ